MSKYNIIEIGVIINVMVLAICFHVSLCNPVVALIGSDVYLLSCGQVGV